MLEVMPSNQCSSHSVDGFCQDVTVCVCYRESSVEVWVTGLVLVSHFMLGRVLKIN